LKLKPHIAGSMAVRRRQETAEVMDVELALDE
jgi:hypothetical protein